MLGRSGVATVILFRLESPYGHRTEACLRMHADQPGCLDPRHKPEPSEKDGVEAALLLGFTTAGTESMELNSSSQLLSPSATLGNAAREKYDADIMRVVDPLVRWLTEKSWENLDIGKAELYTKCECTQLCQENCIKSKTRSAESRPRMAKHQSFPNRVTNHDLTRRRSCDERSHHSQRLR